MTKTTKKNIQERLNTWTANFERTTEHGDTYISLTQEEFESLKDLVFSNLNADLSKRLEVWTNTATGITFFRTYSEKYLAMKVC